MCIFLLFLVLYEINEFFWEYLWFMEKEFKLYICWYYMLLLYFILINCFLFCKYFLFILLFVLFFNDGIFVIIRNCKCIWVKKLCDIYVFVWILYKFN